MTHSKEAKPGPFSYVAIFLGGFRLNSRCVRDGPVCTPLPPTPSLFIPCHPILACTCPRGVAPGHPRLRVSAEGRNPKNTKRNGNLRCAESALPFQIPNTKYPWDSADCNVSLSQSHARTSSPARVMSFATLCLTLVHVFGTWLGQLTSTRPQNQPQAPPALLT